MRRFPWLAGLPVGSVITALVAFSPQPAQSGEDCMFNLHLYDNLKIDRTFLPDPHGDTEVFPPPPNQGWQLDHRDLHDYFHHNNFQDHGYSHDAHEGDVCVEAYGGGEGED